MREKPLSYDMIFEKSKELKLTFSDLMAGAVLEEIVRRICKSEYSDVLWLRNGRVLGKEQYRKNLVLNLEYDYVIQKKLKEQKSENEFLLELAKELKEKLFDDCASYGVKFEVSLKQLKNHIRLNLTGNIEDMEIPVCIRIFFLKDEKLVPRKETLTCLLFPEITVTYYSYPTESLLAEHFMEIVTRLELIQDISAYYEIYYLLERKSVDGRKVKDYIEELCAKKGLSTAQNRMAMIADYQNYTYMKKKWKVFLRSVHSAEPGWEDVIDRFVKFFEPIWQAIMDDLVFFGDWMPDLNRFL